MTAKDLPAEYSTDALYLVDVSSFIFRAYYAIRNLTNRKGEPVNAIYGVATMLARLIEEAKPRYISIVYDSKEPSFRKLAYDAYKANRSAAPDDLVPQFDRIEQLIESMGFHSIRRSGIEADDLIATLARRWTRENPKHQAVLVTGDKDLMQLVDDRTAAWDTMKGVLYRAPEVEEKFGIPPTLVRDYLALVGDSSDNVPGVPSIGPKGAVELLKAHGSLEKLLLAAQTGQVAGKKGETLRENEKLAILSRDLVTLKEDVEFDFSIDSFLSPFPDGKIQVKPECIRLLKEYDFNSLVQKWSKLPGEGDADIPVVDEKNEPSSDASTPSSEPHGFLPISKPQFKTIRTDSELGDLIALIRKKGEFAVDTETTSLNPREAVLVGISISCEDDVGYYIPINHRGNESEIQLPESLVLEQLKSLLEDPRLKKIGQNLKYDGSIFLNHGIRIDGIGADTMVADYVLDPEGKHGLDTLAKKTFDYQMLTYEEVCGKGKDQIPFDLVTVETATRYSAEDAWMTWNLWRVFRPRIAAEGLLRVFAEVDIPLVPVLMDMEWAGVSIDVPYLESLNREFNADLVKIGEEIQKYTQGPINLNSPKQLGKLLFEDLKLPTQGKTKTGFSTDASVLEVLAPLHPVPALILQHREVAKLLGTYVEPLPKLRDAKTGKIHAGFHQTVAATGRLSSSDPNLQNIPIRSARGERIRRAFIPSPGNLLLSADYSQIELRLLAEMSRDTELVASFKRGEDVHRRTASEIFGVGVDQINDEQRAVAKAINFGLMYGKSAFGLAQELSISRTEAKDRIDRYFARYSGVKQFLDSLILGAKDRGFVTTLLGRKRVLRDIHARNPALRANAERMAMNTPIQGTAADLMKLAMIRLDERLKNEKARSKFIIQVHDEVVLDCDRDELDSVKNWVKDAMENAFQGIVEHEVPFTVNLAVGENWMDLK